LAAVVLLAATAGAGANIVLDVNQTTGDLQLVGAAGDTFSCYVIYSASLSQSFISTNWNADRFGATSVANGYGTWMSMGTVAGVTTTDQLGEMCAVYAGFNAGGNADAQTSRIFTFDAAHSAIDLGDHFQVGGLQDLVFGYGTTPGFMNGTPPPPASNDGWLFDGQVHTYTINEPGSYYNGQQYESSGVTGEVVYMPEPACTALLAAGGLLALLRRRGMRGLAASA
jgi:hypothetical protein